MRLGLFVGSLMLAFASTAQAQPAPSGAPPVAASTPAASPAQAAEGAEPEAKDGLRFRGGISLGGGLEKVSIVSGPMVGVDGRLGVQVNNLLAIYAQPHLSFGSLSASAGGTTVSGATGTFAVAAMADVTLIDHLFVGAGFGYGILNNPKGPMFQARLGGYPLMTRGENGIRRKGLMIGGDFRSIFITGATGIMLMAAIGYEAF